MIPTRHNRAAIDRYFPIMQKVNETWPKALMVNPSPLAPETFACRFRDAVRGIIEYTQGDAVHMHTVINWFANYSVVVHKGTCLIGDPTEIKKVLKHQTSAITYGTVISGEVVTSETTLDNPDDKVLAAIVLLLELNFLQHAILTNVTEAQITRHFTGIRPLEVVVQNNTLTIF